MNAREQALAVILLRRWLEAAAQLQLTRNELALVARLETETNAFLNPYEETGAEASS